MKKLVIGIIIGIMLTVTVNSAVEYSLKESEWVVKVDGQAVKDEKLPMLLLEPGYNYAPVAVFRDVCGIMGVSFEANVEAKEIRITTKEEKIVSTKTAPASTPVTVTAEYTEPYTLMRDGIKKAFMGDINKLLKPYGYDLADSGESNWTLILRNKQGLIFDNIPFSMHEYQGEGKAFINYDFYEQNIKPLITN